MTGKVVFVLAAARSLTCCVGAIGGVVGLRESGKEGLWRERKKEE